MAQPRIESCDIFNYKFKKMQDLNNHMATIHQETDHMRIERLTRTFQSMVNQASESSKIQQYNKSYDCTECGVVFVTSDLIDKHNKEHHTFEVQDEVKNKQVVEDEEALLTLTSDLTEALSNIPIQDNDLKVINEAEKESNENLFQFLNSEFQTPLKAQVTRGQKRDIESMQCNVSNDTNDPEYIKETYPKIDEKDEDSKSDELQGITFKGRSKKYLSAHNKLKDKLVKDAEFEVEKII